MDFSQTKLTKMEWESIEIPVPDQEKQILRLIMEGYYNINIKQNDNRSLLSFMKIEYTNEIEMYIYSKYFAKEIQNIVNTKKNANIFLDGFTPKMPNISKFKSPKKIDLMRLQNMDANIQASEFDKSRIFEFILLNFCQLILQDKDKSYTFYLYTILQMNQAIIPHVNIYVKQFVEQFVQFIQTKFSTKILQDTFSNAYTIIEKNPYILRFENKTLYDHQKQLFQLFRPQTFDDHVSDSSGDLRSPSELADQTSPVAKLPSKLVVKEAFSTPCQRLTSRVGTQAPRPDFRGCFAPGEVSSSMANVSHLPKLVMYTAPTGTGKTMSPLGLSNGYRVIYICAARHIGLALAKSAISMEKRVAFAFGCDTASDIRLHYYSAVEYTKNRKTGGIYKVDNSNGSKVEIMICDVYSYLTAMHYMLAFHSENEIIMYWDEPTISLDQETHPLHSLIQRNWTENKLSNIVLSCATLPEENEITDCLMNYRERFNGGSVHRVSSCDCKKSISLIDPHGRATLPHLLFSSYTDIQVSVEHIKHNPSIMRYLDLREIIRMINYVQELPDALPEMYFVSNYFMKITEITMNRIKQYYLDILSVLNSELYTTIHEHLKSTLQGMFDPISSTITKSTSLQTNTKTSSLYGTELSRSHSIVGLPNSTGDRRSPSELVEKRLHVPFAPLPNSTGNNIASELVVKRQEAPLPNPFRTGQYSLKQSNPSNPVPHRGVLLTTEDSHTLTDGPTIYITEDVKKLSQFYIHQSKIPEKVLERLMEKIEANNVIQKKMDILTKSIDDSMGKEVEKDKKMEKEAFKPEVKRLMNSLEELRNQIKMITMSLEYIPNTKQHQLVWVTNKNSLTEFVTNAFVPNIDETSVKKIMELDVENSMKLLLLMGVGVFDSMLIQNRDASVASYLEVMKRLAYEQKLFLIIASSDYIYGTNYQLCHGFLGKDLMNMTQQKIIQAMGRIGRNNIQQEYTIRFRDAKLIERLFLPVEDGNMEAINMGKLLIG